MTYLTPANDGANIDPVVAKYLALPVPRYTSYPTAPHFNDGITQAHYRSWLKQLDPAVPISLYLHVPFCKQMCWYCGCNMKLAAKYAPVASYVDTLIAEIKLVAAALPGRFSVDHLHWGGGTPTALSPDDLDKVMDSVWSYFDRAPGAEIAIESDPRTLSADMITRLGQLGFNRASFGVQEFDPDVQKAINRIQPPEMVADCVAGLREAGINAINFDLIYGLPHQTEATLVRTVEQCDDIKPDRLALFGYAHVPWMAKNQRMIKEEHLPAGAARLNQALSASTALERGGYLPIGLDHFALPDDPLAKAAKDGTMRRNFQGYTTDSSPTMIGLGATSIGRTPYGFFQNIVETGAYARTVASGDLPVAKGYAFKGEDTIRARAIEALMCQGSVDTAQLADEFGATPDWARDVRTALGDMRRDGLVRIDGDVIALTPRGWPLMRVAAAAFDSYLQNGKAQHSRAV